MSAEQESIEVRFEDGRTLLFRDSAHLLQFEADLQEAIRQQLTPTGQRRWRCPSCGGANVQVSFPTWYYESTDFHLAYYEVDAEADILWWYCDDCEETDSGSPIDLNDELEEVPHAVL